MNLRRVDCSERVHIAWCRARAGSWNRLFSISEHYSWSLEFCRPPVNPVVCASVDGCTSGMVKEF